MNKWIDISVPLRTGMAHWPGDIPVMIQQTSDMSAGDVANLRNLSMCAHVGTHMDAPLHFVANGQAIDSMPLDATVGPARVIAIEDEQAITRAELQRHKPEPGERLLFKTRNSSVKWAECRYFLKNYVAVTPDAARYLCERSVRTIGIDYLSIGPYGNDGIETHQIILGAGIWVMEGLNLSAVRPGNYELICLPLKIKGGDGAPARAILREV